MVTGAWWQEGGQRGRGNQCQAHGLTGSPGSCLDDVAVGTTRGRRTSRAGETWGRGGGSSLPPLLHADPTRDQDPSHPSPEDQTLPRWPRAREVLEKPTLRARYHDWPLGSCWETQEST